MQLTEADRQARCRLQSERVELEERDVAPLASFLHAWLEAVKDREWTYNYWDTREALSSLFLAAPFMDHFHEQDVLEVHGHLCALFEAFATLDMQDDAATGRQGQLPVHQERLGEIHWTLAREGRPRGTSCGGSCAVPSCSQ